MHAKAEEAERRLREDRAAHAERRLNRDRRQRGRDDMPRQDPRSTRAQRTGRLDELELPRAQHLPANQPRVADPPDERESQDHIGQARTEYRDHRDCQQQPGKREEDIHHAADDFIDDAAEISGDRAEDRSEQRRHADDDEPDEERDSRPREHTREDVAAKLVEPEPVQAGRAFEAQRKLLIGRMERHDRRTNEGGDNRHQHDRGTHPRHS